MDSEKAIAIGKKYAHLDFEVNGCYPNSPYEFFLDGERLKAKVEHYYDKEEKGHTRLTIIRPEMHINSAEVTFPKES